MTNKSKNIFDFCVGAIISLLTKSSNDERIHDDNIIKLALDIIDNNKFIKNENNFNICKKYNIDEESLFKIISKKDSIDNLNKLFFLIEIVEKKTVQSKGNMANVISVIVKIFDNLLVDYIIINLFASIKPFSELQKKDLEFERSIIKMIFKKNDYNYYKYFLRYIYSIFDQTIDLRIRKHLFNSIIVVFKINGKSFFNNCVENVLKDVQKGVLLEYLNCFNFSILNEIVNFKFQNIDNTIKYFKCFDLIISENFDLETEKNQEKKIEIQNFLIQTLKNIIILSETIIKILKDNNKEKCSINVEKFYEFYFFIQVKVIVHLSQFFRIFVNLFDENKKKKLEILFYSKNYKKAKKNHISSYPYQLTFVENLFSLKNPNEMSIIFHNWVIFLCKSQLN